MRAASRVEAALEKDELRMSSVLGGRGGGVVGGRGTCWCTSLSPVHLFSARR